MNNRKRKSPPESAPLSFILLTFVIGAICLSNGFATFGAFVAGFVIGALAAVVVVD